MSRFIAVDTRFGATLVFTARPDPVRRPVMIDAGADGTLRAPRRQYRVGGFFASYPLASDPLVVNGKARTF